MSAVTDFVYRGNLYPVVPSAAHNSATTGTAVNRSNATPGGPYEALTFFVQVGTVTDGAHPLTVVESPDGTTWNNVAMIDLLIPASNAAPKDANGNYTAAFGTLASNVNQKVGYIGLQPYVNITSADAGTTGAVYGVQALLSSPLHYPV